MSGMCSSWLMMDDGWISVLALEWWDGMKSLVSKLYSS